MKKKAQFIDILYIAYIIFIIAILGIISQHIVSESETSLKDTSIIDSEKLNLITNYKNRQIGMVDQIFLIALFGLPLIAIVSAFFVASYPWFYLLMAVILGIFSWFNAIYANIFQEIASMSDFLPIVEQFTFIPLVMRWFPLTMFVFSIIIAVVMTAKGRGSY